MKTVGTKAVLLIAYQCLWLFIIGVMCNLVGLVTGAVYVVRCLIGVEELSTVMVLGVVAGSVSYISDILLILAMDRRTCVVNMSKF